VYIQFVVDAQMSSKQNAPIALCAKYDSTLLLQYNMLIVIITAVAQANDHDVQQQISNIDCILARHAETSKKAMPCLDPMLTSLHSVSKHAELPVLDE
jgi:hypothetical protein